MLTFLETLRELSPEIHSDLDDDRAKAVETYLAIVLDKASDYNARLTFWDPMRGIRHAFSRHDFAFRWNYCEFDASANLLPWVTRQVVDAYKGLAKLASPTQYVLWDEPGARHPVERLQVWQGSAAHMPHIPDGTVHNITVDPPYYDNVMYAELSDFFYVWLKRSVGHLYPEFFGSELTDKDEEAVSNPARFADTGSKKKQLADRDYEYKMEIVFRECARVLRDDGVMTVMFTHKRVEAWDTLASALLNAGFSVEASWPVHTESEHSLHQARKNAARSTILLVCRKRPTDAGPTWWDDIKGEVKRVAGEKAMEFAKRGISGVDLYISVFGPVLSVISRRWPIVSAEMSDSDEGPVRIRPDAALDLARREVIALQKQRLLSGMEVKFDPVTDWYLMAWDSFKAGAFPYDEARKLAIALGVDLEAEVIRHRRLVKRRSDFVEMLPPAKRRRKGIVDEGQSGFDAWVDAVHTALMVLEEDGEPFCHDFLAKSGLIHDDTFVKCVEAMIKAIPRAQEKGRWLRPEAELLERLRVNFFPHIKPPPDERDEIGEQLRLKFDKNKTVNE